MAVNKEICCPSCSEVIVKSMNGSEIKIRSKVTIFRDNDCYAVCKGCNAEVAIPLKIDQEVLHKSLTPTKIKSTRLYLNEEYIDKKT